MAGTVPGSPPAWVTAGRRCVRHRLGGGDGARLTAGPGHRGAETHSYADHVDATGTVEVVVGRIGKPHGLRGEVTVEVRTDEPDVRFAVGTVLTAEPPRGSASGLTTLEVVSVRWHQTTLLVHFAQLPDRTAAEGARGTLLLTHVPADATPDDPDEFYDHQLVGLAVLDLDGRPIGEVTGVVHGAQDLLEVHGLRRPPHAGAVRGGAGS